MFKLAISKWVALLEKRTRKVRNGHWKASSISFSLLYFHYYLIYLWPCQWNHNAKISSFNSGIIIVFNKNFLVVNSGVKAVLQHLSYYFAFWAKNKNTSHFNLRHLCPAWQNCSDYVLLGCSQPYSDPSFSNWIATPEMLHLTKYITI